MTKDDDREHVMECAAVVGSFVARWAVDMMFRVRDGVHLDKLVGAKEAANYLGVSERTIERMKKDEKLTALKIGSRLRFRLAELQEHKQLKKKGN